MVGQLSDSSESASFRQALKRGRINCLSRSRRGASVVEVAAVMPVFLVFVFFIMQFGHAYMVKNMLNSACRQAARTGSTVGVSTSDTEARVVQIMAPIAPRDKIRIMVKDTEAIDAEQPQPISWSNTGALPDIELLSAKPRQPFLVRAEVRYGDIGFLVAPGFRDLLLAGQAITRHE